MATSSFGVLFLMSLLTGGVTDLLDAVPTDEYWRQKGAQVTEAFIRDELAPPPAAGDISKLIDALGDDVAANRDAAAAKIRAMGPGVVPQLQAAMKDGNPEVAARCRRLITDVQTLGQAVQVRKLMALRAAGEKKMKGLLPRLNELAKSEDVFVSDYAAAAVAQIEGRPYERKHPASGDDAWLLPAGCRTVVHIGIIGTGKPISTEDLEKMMKAMGGDGPGPDGPTPQQRTEEMRKFMEQVIGIADKTGNIRIDGATIGISGDANEKGMYVAVVVRGRYDVRAVTELIASMSKEPPKTVAGVTGFNLGKEFTALFPSGTHAALIGGPREAQFPTEELAQALKTGQGQLKGVAEMTKLIEKVDTKLPLWGVASITESYRQAPLLKALDWVTLTGKSKGQGLTFKFEAQGRNGPAVAEAVGMINQGVNEAKADIKREIERMQQPEMKKMMQVAVSLMESIKCAADEKDPTRAAMTGEIEVPPATLMMGFFGSVRSGHMDHAPPPKVAPPVAPPGDVPAPPPPRVPDPLPPPPG